MSEWLYSYQHTMLNIFMYCMYTVHRILYTTVQYSVVSRSSFFLKKLKLLFSKNVLNGSNVTKDIYIVKKNQIRMISKGSFDTEDCWKFSFAITKINSALKNNNSFTVC